MSKINELSFEGQIIYCGLDVHKTNWKVNARMGNVEVEAYSQNPDPARLKKHFSHKFPGAELRVAYEAGFSGFGIQRSLSELGIDCIVVNAADIPASDKDRKRKDDKRDARKLSQELGKGALQGIYIPETPIEHARSLVRLRSRFSSDQVRYKNRIRHTLLFNGLKVKADSERWSAKYVKQLQQMDCGDVVLNLTLKFAIEQYLQSRQLLKAITLEIKNLSKQEPFATVQSILQSIDGIGLINGMVIQTEIMEMQRFKTIDRLCDYAGLVPDIYSTNDNMVSRGVTKRRNEFLRQAIIESSWTLIRKDPAMLLKYQKYCSRMHSNKAIIRIGKHLLARIRHVWNNGKLYERGKMS
jgi:transposase